VTPSLEVDHVPSISSAWTQFDELSARLVRYLNSSGAEFGTLIQALDACWSMAETVQQATAKLSEHTAAASANQDLIRQSMLGGCVVFKNFLLRVQENRRQLACTTKEAGELLATSRHLQENIAPLNHIAFHFRLEASRLSPDDGASVEKAYREMKQVVAFMKQAGDSQESALVTILDKLSAATRSVEQTCSSYAVQAAESEEKVAHNLDLLATAPRDLLRVQNKASALGTVLTNSIREAVKALQGHDAIRQRLEHILGGLAAVRKNSVGRNQDRVGRGEEKREDAEDEERDKNNPITALTHHPNRNRDHNADAGDPPDEPGHALLLQRQQSRCLLEMVVNTGSRIERELDSVIGCAQGIAGDGSDVNSHDQKNDQHVEKFEAAVDRLAALSAEVAGLLAGEAKTGNFVIAQIDPIREMLGANRRQLEVVALSMKRLALNVMVDAHQIPAARGLEVLGVWTADVSDDVLKLARDQNAQFAALGATLLAQASAIFAEVQKVESCRAALLAETSTDCLRKSRRTESEVVDHLCQGAAQLQKKTETLVRSLKFVDEANRLLAELDVVIGTLLELYPKSEKPFDLEAASAGYTMQEQHDAHAMVFGAEPQRTAVAALPDPGQEYGGNVELF
jgi:hypothetical protein